VSQDTAPTGYHIGAKGAPQRTNTVNAIEKVRQLAAERAIDDPVKLGRAARIVRAALARNRLTVEDLTAPYTQDGSAVA